MADKTPPKMPDRMIEDGEGNWPIIDNTNGHGPVFDLTPPGGWDEPESDD